jgi:POT family proton-dependent oligopeptide transporter
LAYFVLPFGGAIGDRWLGRRTAVICGSALIVAGLACLMSERLLLPALAILILGSGLIKANLAAQVGELFPARSARRSGAFAIYLAFLNLGVMLGPLACGWLAQAKGWPFAFAAAGFAMMLGLATYLRMPGTGLGTHSERSDAASSGVPSIGIVAAVVIVVVLCFCAYEQVTNLFLVWIADNVRLDVGGFHIPPAWFVSADGVFTIAMVIATTRLRWLTRLHEGDRLALGCAALVGGYATLAFASWLGLTSIAVPLSVLVMLDLGVALVWPTGLAIVTAHSPSGLAGAMVGIFYLHGFFANLVVGAVGVFYDRMTIPAFWGLHAAITALGLTLALIVRASVNSTGRAG